MRNALEPTTIRNKIAPHFVGLDDNPVWNMVSNFLDGEMIDDTRYTGSYPPHNIISDNEEGKHRIELAVAGYPKESLNVTLEQNTLTISGDKQSNIEDSDSGSEHEYLYKGISSKSFTKKFKLNENTEVNDVSLNNGILTITLERYIPEEKRPKNIPIN